MTDFFAFLDQITAEFQSVLDICPVWLQTLIGAAATTSILIAVKRAVI